MTINQLDLGWRDAYYHRARATDLLERCGRAVRRLGTDKEVAHQLDQVFGPEGRPVSESVLRAARNGAERNYFRAEWLVLLAGDEEVRTFFDKPVLSPEDENRIMRDFVMANAPGLVPQLLRALGRST